MNCVDNNKILTAFPFYSLDYLTLLRGKLCDLFNTVTYLLLCVDIISCSKYNIFNSSISYLCPVFGGVLLIYFMACVMFQMQRI